jgi:DNA-binding YbaB/EbfC family protein
MKSFTDMLKSVRNLESMATDIQAKIAAIEVTGQSGAGLVAVTLMGQGILKQVRIDPSLLRPEDGEMVEDLIVAAHADAKAKLEAATAEEMRALAGGLPLPPGFKMPF